ncbi:MAG: lysophospholipid acyltransferase family protein [Candidatus Omnitrophota bacterium]
MFQFLLYKLGYFLATRLSLKSSYRLAKILSTAQYFFSRTDRNTVKNNLKAIFPDKSDKEITKITKQVFINFGKYLADFLRFSKMDEKIIKSKVKVEGLQYVDEVLSQGKGIIAITAHLGNWELAGITMGLLGYKIMGVVLAHSDSNVDRFFNNQRMINNLEVCTLGRAAYFCLAALKENKMIALVADRDFTEHSVVIDFLNKKAMLPKGPATFHLKTGAPIIGGFLVRLPDDSFKFTFEKPFIFKLSGEKEKDIEAITQQYAQTIEKYIRQYPEQWYMFRKFWIG